MGYKLLVDIFKMLRGNLKQKEKKKKTIYEYTVLRFTIIMMLESKG